MTSFLFFFLPASPKTEAGLGITFSVRTSVPARQDVTCTDYVIMLYSLIGQQPKSVKNNSYGY
jgi:hypothetical protein